MFSTIERMLKFINITCLAIYCSFIYYLSSQPSLLAPSLFKHQDKLFHMGAYFIMGVLAWHVFKHYYSRMVTIFILSLCFCSLYGISDEWHQSFVAGREADFLDWIADTIGACIALSIVYVRNKKIKQRV